MGRKGQPNPNCGKTFPIEVLTMQEVGLLFDAFGGRPVDVRNRAIFALMLYAQLRCGELLKLKPADVDIESGVVTVLWGKGGKRRMAAIAPQGVGYVAEWAGLRPNGPLFFATKSGKKILSCYIRRIVSQKAVKAGITKRVHPHGLRHTGAFFLANSGIDHRHISKQLGHSHLSTTAIYIDHLYPVDVIDAIKRVSW